MGEPVYSRVPKISRDAQELLAPTYGVEPVLFRYYAPIVMPAGLLCCSLMTCYTLRMPVMSALPLHTIVTALGLAYGLYHEKKYRSRTALRDAYLRDYIRLHPEDFKMEPARKIADILEPWAPIR